MPAGEADREKLRQGWLALPELTVSAQPIANHLIEQGFVDREDGMLFIGPEAERRFRRRHFMGLMAVFTAPPEFTVLQGRNQIGRIDPVLLIDWVEGPRLLLLGGRAAGGSPGPTGNVGDLKPAGYGHHTLP